MDPVAFKLFGLDIRWYGILISTGIVLGAVLAIKRAKKENIHEEKVLDLLLFAIPAAIIGARAYYVIFNWNAYVGDVLSMINVRQGGLAIHGGVIGGLLVGYFFCKKNNISFKKMADICAPSIILGQAIGRWGNFINQEAHGGPTDLPWGIMVDGIRVHPTFLYESIWNFLIFCFLLWYDKKKKFNGELFLLYAALYSTARFFIEGLRTDSLMLGSFRAAQLMSVGVIIAAGTIIYIGKRKSKI
ncbi:prolipoprotein diacylglyceryl transferase [Marinisporobacter balticus]|uniref:Phosphatidylglycerol--prolipoprotein diacylglyceryl transferase n=1 Tax=Marinisporobacter balticus TaxID=2018667 RepID=A0A4R2L280_9FIRM|nr:prolipoprotein diacylglyceryl transferase [Marinisporobacter balticus]TCO79317.1 prolipoprotein diacylglyceryl transferase [Marinisporobacter balticus]